jgi:hypothetical protein
MELGDVTALILTRNEAANLRETLKSLRWVNAVVIVDSGSTDGTLSIASEFGNVRVVQRPFDHFADQCNFGLTQIDSSWTLSLDADYKCPPSLAGDVAMADGSKAGYSAAFRYCVYGKPLRRTLYPPRVVLHRTKLCHYERDGHAHRVRVEGPIGQLPSCILHDDWKPLSTWLGSQIEYARMEMDKVMSTPHDQLSWKDRLRKKIIFAPALTLVYCLFWKGLILDGWAGVYYTTQRVYAELLLSLMLLDKRLIRK